jgi:hypothetical protein
VTATDTANGVVTGGATVTVIAAAATRLTVVAPPSATAGSQFTVTVTAFDQFNNTATGYAGTIHFSSNDFNENSSVPVDYTFVAGDNGVHTFTNGVKFLTVGDRTVTATDTVAPTVTGAATIHINPAAPALLLLSAPINPTAGSPFSLTVTAKDQFNNVATGYTGTVQFTKSDKGAGSALPADYTFVAGDNDVHTFTIGATLVTAGSQSITATDAANSLSAMAFANVAPAATNSFAINAPATVNPGVAFSITVTARDPYGNVTPGYLGTVHFTTSDADAGVSVPGDYPFVVGDGGVHTFTNGVILQTAPGQTVTATDTANAAVTGTSDTINVNARPTATNDAYTAVGNTELRVGTAAPSYPAAVVSGSVLDNDSGGSGPITVDVAGVNTAGLQGSLSINSDGTFTFVPTFEFTGPTSFQYKAKDSLGNLSPTTATVTITINTRVWYVDSVNEGAVDGSAAHPLQSLTQLDGTGGAGDLDGPNDYIFVYPGGGPYGGGIELEAGEKLYGRPFGLTVSGYTLVAPGSGSNPTITNAAGAGITLAEGVDVEQVNVANTSGDGITWPDGLNSATIGSNMSVTNSGQQGFRRLSGSGTVTFGADISGSGAEAVSVTNRTGGTVIVSGNITAGPGADGIVLSGNSGGVVVTFSGASKTLSTGANRGLDIFGNTAATINFINGGLAITTTSGVGADLDGGGSLSISGIGNSITTDSGTTFRVGAAGANTIAVDCNADLTGDTGRHVDVQNHSTGAITLSGNLANTGAGASGILIENNVSGQVTFSGTTKTLSTGDNGAVTLAKDGDMFIDFTGGGLVITTDAGDGFYAGGGGTFVTVQGPDNTISTGTKRWK